MGDLSPHFSRHEFRCKCGCGLDTVDVETIELCEVVREIVGASVTVVSGHRCATHNAKVGGGRKSQHLHGRAADLAVKDPRAVYGELCRRYPDTYGFGVYPSHGFVHVDSRTNAARWEG